MGLARWRIVVMCALHALLAPHPGEPHMTFRTAFAVLAGALTLALAAPVSAETPADFTNFTAACLGAQHFLIGELPAGTDPATILTPLCTCIVTAFAPFSQNSAKERWSSGSGHAQEGQSKPFF